MRNDQNEQERTASPRELITAGSAKRSISFPDQTAQRLVELARPKSGDCVLDVMTGDGAVALYAAGKVTPAGQVIGVEGASPPLALARQRLAAGGWSHVTFVQGDLERLDFADAMFDCVICSSICLLPDLLVGLREWRRVLKPGGTVAFSSYGAKAFQPFPQLLTTCLQPYVIVLPVSEHLFPWQRLTELEQCSDLLRNAGFSVIDICSEQLGYHLANPDEWWEFLWHSGAHKALDQLTLAALTQFKTEYLAAVAKLATAQGIWLNVATIFAVGQKG